MSVNPLDYIIQKPQVIFYRRTRLLFSANHLDCVIQKVRGNFFLLHRNPRHSLIGFCGVKSTFRVHSDDNLRPFLNLFIIFFKEHENRAG